MLDPYAAPQSNVEDVLSDFPSVPRRPVLVWVICCFYGFSSVASLLLAALFLFGGIPLSPEPRARIAAVDVELAFSVLASLLMVVFVVQLFRLRASAAGLGIVLLILTAASTTFQLLRADGPASSLAAARLDVSIFQISLLLGVAILAAVTAYTRRLAKQGLLR